FQQIQDLRQSKNKELENVLDTFLTEIKEENMILEKQFETETEDSSSKNRLHKVVTEKSMTNPLVQTKEDEYAPSIQGQVYQLYYEGIPVDEIAKQLGRGKTEIDLMIKFKGNMK